METAAARIEVCRPLAPEEAARGDFYALLARLFHAAPDAALLQTLAHADPLPGEGDRDLASAWDELSLASSAMDPDAATDEYEALFVGVGKARVSIYAGYYTGALAIDHPRVRLQADLARFGLARQAQAAEPEDHFAGLFDVMRVLAAGGAGRDPAPIGEQKGFFEAYLKPGAPRFCEAVAQAAEANYYRRVAALARAFIAIEIESFVLN